MENHLKKLNVTITGNTEAERTLIFSHGFGLDQTTWQHLVPAFEKDFRIVMYDLMGCGKSDLKAYSPAKYESLQMFAADLSNLCEALHIENAVIVSHSVSCMVAVLATAIRPHSFSKAVFLNGSPRYLNDTGYTGGFDQAALNDLYYAMEANYEGWISGFAPLAMGYPEKPQFGDEFARSLKNMRPDVALAIAKTIFQSDIRHELNCFSVDTLIVQSKNDIAVPESVAHYLNLHLENSTVKIIDAAGHFPHVTRPAELLRVIKPFIFSTQSKLSHGLLSTVE